MFKVNLKADINGTSLAGYVHANCKKLIEKFGEPDSGDDYKVSTEWIFESEAGRVFTLYDYKETAMYNSGLPTPQEFRDMPEYEWHIGAANGTPISEVNTFIEFIKGAV